MASDSINVFVLTTYNIYHGFTCVFQLSDPINLQCLHAAGVAPKAQVKLGSQRSEKAAQRKSSAAKEQRSERAAQRESSAAREQRSERAAQREGSTARG